jgi:predicted  nucleic acid-binding Zn-ribbon protein
MSDDQNTETQNTNPGTIEQPGAEQQEEQPKVFDADYVKKLRDENAKWRTKAQEHSEAAKRLEEIEESQKTEQQKLQDQLEATQQELDQYKAQEAHAELVKKVAGASGVDAELVSDLRGDTYEELLSSAEKLKSRMTPSYRPDPGQGNDPGIPLNSDKLEDKLRRAVGAK